MSVSSTVRKAGPYTSNGSQTDYSFAFKVFLASEVVVTRTDLAGVETVLTLTTDYAVSLDADQNANPGGTVTLNSPATSGFLVTLSSNVELSQSLTLNLGGGWYPTVVADAFDRVTILVQQLAEQVSRAVKVAVSSALSPDQLIATLAADVAAANASAGSATASAAAASVSATTAANAASSAAYFVDTSVTSTAIGTGSKTLTLASGSARAWTIGTTIRVASRADPANFMEGQITAYAHPSVTVNVSTVGGSGTFTDWSIGLGTPGSAFAAHIAATGAAVHGLGTMSTQAASAVAITGGVASLTYEREAVVALGNVAGSTALNWAAGGFVTATITNAAGAFTHSNLPSGVVGFLTVEVTNGGVATSGATLFAGVKWSGGAVPTFTASGRDIVTLMCHDGATVNGVALKGMA